MSKAKELVKNTATTTGIAAGTAAGSAAVASAFGALTTTTTSLVTPAVFAPFMAGAAAHPATWALALSNPVGQIIAVGGLATLGGVVAYKAISKVLD